MMAVADKELIGLRAESLAVVYLTRRSDLIVRTEPHDTGIDLLVSIKTNDHMSGRLFGVIVKGSSAKQWHSTENGLIWRMISEVATPLDYKKIEDFPFPVCLFVFRLEDDTGYWFWLRRPEVDGSQNRSLVVDRSHILQRLDNDAIDELVKTVNRWYEAGRNADEHD
jgi:hypothetical protein